MKPWTLTLAETLAGAERAAKRVERWPQWKREVSGLKELSPIRTTGIEGEDDEVVMSTSTKVKWRDEGQCSVAEPILGLGLQVYVSFQDGDKIEWAWVVEVGTDGAEETIEEKSGCKSMKIAKSRAEASAKRWLKKALKKFE